MREEVLRVRLIVQASGSGYLLWGLWLRVYGLGFRVY